MRAALVLLALCVSCSDPSSLQRLPIGSPCRGPSECGTSPYDCAPGYPGGYCDKPCGADAECPSDSLCSPTARKCRRRCASAQDCRVAEGYMCVTIAGGNLVCEAAAIDGGTS